MCATKSCPKTSTYSIKSTILTAQEFYPHLSSGTRWKFPNETRQTTEKTAVFMHNFDPVTLLLRKEQQSFIVKFLRISDLLVCPIPTI